MENKSEKKDIQQDEDKRDVNSNEQIKTDKRPRKSPSEDDQERKELNEHTRKDHDKVHGPYSKDEHTDEKDDDPKGRNTEKDKSSK